MRTLCATRPGGCGGLLASVCFESAERASLDQLNLALLASLAVSSDGKSTDDKVRRIRPSTMRMRMRTALAQSAFFSFGLF